MDGPIGNDLQTVSHTYFKWRRGGLKIRRQGMGPGCLRSIGVFKSDEKNV